MNFFQIENENELKAATNYECNYVGCKHERLPPIQYRDTICDN